jgi:hypothetical protein
MTLIKMPVHGKAELQFWIRAFQLQDEIDDVIRMLNDKDERKTAFAPIISEYESGSIKWVFLLGTCIDPLGIESGAGMVWLTQGPKHLEEATGERDKLANMILREAEEQGKFDEVIEMDPKKDV